MKRIILLSSVEGVVAASGLLFLYIGVMFVTTESLSYAISELEKLSFWVLALVIGFGTQVGLFRYVARVRLNSSVQKKSMAASAATSTTAMIACCAHHITDVLPLIGLSFAAAFLAKYQTWFLAVGIASNAIGIVLLLRQLKRMYV